MILPAQPEGKSTCVAMQESQGPDCRRDMAASVGAVEDGEGNAEGVYYVDGEVRSSCEQMNLNTSKKLLNASRYSVLADLIPKCRK